MRAFVAVDVPEVSVAGRSTGDEGQPAHVTLQFLGEVPETRVAAVAEALSPVARSASPFDVTLEGLGAFPTSRRPRVVWVGIGTGAEPMVQLADAVARALGHVGFPPESRRLTPHVTLFRVRTPREEREAHDLLAHSPSGVLATGTVAELLLKESRLDRAGARHRVVERFPLVGRSD